MGISAGIGITGGIPAGVVVPFAGSAAPSGWLLCDGSAVSRTTYGQLYTAIGTTYGTGDGSTTFNLPDLRGRVVAGKDDMGGSAASRLTSTVLTASNTLGATGGTQTHTMSTAEMPSHTHTQSEHRHGRGVITNGASASNPGAYIGSGSATVFYTNNGYGYTADSTGTDPVTATNQNTGGGGAHLNTQPTIVLNYIVKAA